MAYTTGKNFLAFLIRFQDNYLYFTSKHSGKKAAQLLELYVQDQIDLAQLVYGDRHAIQVQALASELSRTN